MTNRREFLAKTTGVSAAALAVASFVPTKMISGAEALDVLGVPNDTPTPDQGPAEFSAEFHMPSGDIATLPVRYVSMTLTAPHCRVDAYGHMVPSENVTTWRG